VADTVTATFNLNVESNAAQVAADGAEGLANLQEKMLGSVDELRNLNAAFRALKGGAGVGSAALDDLKNKIGAQKAALASQQQAYLKAGGTFKELGERNKKQAEREAAQARAKAAWEEHLKKLSAAKMVTQKAEAKNTAAMVGVLASAAAAYVAVAAAVAVGVAALFRYGIQVADTRRSELLSLEGMTKIRYGLYGLGAGYGLAADKAGFLQDQIDEVSAGSATGRDKIAGYAEQLYKTGLRAGNLQLALKAVATVASTQGDEQASRFVSMAAGARLAGVSVKALADDVQARLGGIAEAQMLSLTAQTAKLKENFARLFSGLKIDPLLRGLKSVTDMFRADSEEGRALKQIIETIFQPLIDSAPTVGELVENTFQGIIIGALLLEGEFMDLQIAYYQAFGNPKVLKNIDLLKVATYGGVFAVGALTAAIVAGAAALTAIAGAALAVPAAVSFVSAACTAAGEKIGKWVAAAYDYGANFVTGIVNGVTAGAGKLIKAVGSLAHSAAAAFRDALGIHSPSTVMFKSGGFTVDGAVDGVKAGKPRLERAVRDSIARPMLDLGAGDSGAPAAAAPARQQPAPVTVTFTGPINVGTALSIADVTAGIRRGVEQVMAGALITAGGVAA
jgi:hypothetical protein